MPQTRYVLRKALEKKLTPVVVINKMDLTNARLAYALEGVQDLFLELATDSEQLDFPVVYASARQGYAVLDPSDPRVDMRPLFETIVGRVPPPPGDRDGDFQMLTASLTYDNHLGQIAIGRVSRGRVSPGDAVMRLNRQGVFVFQGLERREVQEAPAGEIVAISGVDEVGIGDTIAAASAPEALPTITIDEPTVRMTFGVNTSPLAGKDGGFGTARQIRARLMKELQTNVSLKVDETDSADAFLVSGRGELHLGILIETMRREGFELQVSKPEAVTKVVDGVVVEPNESLFIDTREEFIGALTENLSTRLAKMTDMLADGLGNVRMAFHIPTRGLIGFNGFFVRATRGQGVVNSVFLDWERLEGQVGSSRTGMLVASEGGVAVSYGLNNAQGRGMMLIDPGTPVYEGMIVGLNSRDDDINVNVCKEKKMTNIRAASSDDAIRLTPPIRLSLEEAMDMIAADELVEVTPSSLRLRKKALSATDRHKLSRDRAKA